MMNVGWFVDSKKYNFSLHWIKSLRCNYGDCGNLSATLFKMSDIPESKLGIVKPTYDVYVNLCRDHIRKLKIEDKEPMYLDFALINDNGDAVCTCLRCGHVFTPEMCKKEMAGHVRRDKYGEIPVRCLHCHNNKWKVDPLKKAPSTAFMSKDEKKKIMQILTTPSAKEKIVKGGVK